MYTYHFPRPALTSDIVLFRFPDYRLQVLLIKRKSDPFRNTWAFPGGFVDEDETAEQAAARELWEETGIHEIQLHQLYANTNLDRDPRGWTISVIFCGFVRNNFELIAGDDAVEAKWYAMDELPELAFDHKQIAKKVLSWLDDLMRFKLLGQELLPDVFELKQLYSLYLSVNRSVELCESIVKRLVSKKIILRVGGKWQFEKIRYQMIQKGGFLN